VNARDLHISLEVGRDFSTWIKHRVEECQLELNVDYVFPESGGNYDHVGRPTIEWFVTLDAAREICIIERTARGKEVRKYFIACERQLKSVQFDAVAALDDPAFLLKTLQTYAQRNLDQQQVLQVQAPKVEAHDRIAEAYGSVCLADAKTLGVPPKTLIRWVRQNGWTYCRPGTADIGYQSRIQSGYLIHKVTMVPQEDGTERAFTQVRVTPKGMLELVKYFPSAVSVA
jgi:anti-repressor protein